MSIYTSRENTHTPLSSTLKDSQKIHDFTNVNNSFIVKNFLIIKKKIGVGYL